MLLNFFFSPTKFPDARVFPRFSSLLIFPPNDSIIMFFHFAVRLFDPFAFMESIENLLFETIGRQCYLSNIASYIPYDRGKKENKKLNDIISHRKVTKVLRREDEVEGQKNTGKIQTWKRDQSEGILEGGGRRKMQTMQKERRRPETRNRRMWNNGRTRGHRESAKRDRRRFKRTESNNKEEKTKGCTARRLKPKD